MMTSKERLLTALHRGMPDRLPVSLHQWQQYHLDKYLGGITPLAAFERFGMDAQIQYFESMGQFWLVDADFAKFSTPEWIDQTQIISNDPENRVVHHEIRTPGGTLTYKTGGDRKTTWITEYLIKQPEDIELIRRYMPVPKLDLAPIRAAYDEVGDHGILRGFVWGDQAGCWQHACCLIDINRLLLLCFDEPRWVHELLVILLEKKLRFVESMKGAKFDLVETGGGRRQFDGDLAPASRGVLPALRSEAARRIARARLLDHLSHVRRDGGDRGPDRGQRVRRLRDARPAVGRG